MLNSPSRFGMFDLNINNFVDTLRHMHAIKIRIESNFSDETLNQSLVDDLREGLANDFSEIGGACKVVHANLAAKSAFRFSDALRQSVDEITIKTVHGVFNDIESRMKDECEDITVLILDRQERSLYYSTADVIAGWSISTASPEAARELEEASRCYALGRATASVFHGMRMLEIGLKSFSSLLGIPEPETPTERNWGKILNKIKIKIDAEYPKNERLPNSLGSTYEKIYATLEAVKNPWRNATMHVESFYQDAEARLILNNTMEFLRLISLASVVPKLDLESDES